MPRNARLNELRKRLLVQGLPAREVHRYIGELRDHRLDLIEEGAASGLSHALAESAADQRLGQSGELAEAALRRFRRSTCVGRHPWMSFVWAPLFVLLFTWIVVLAIIGIGGHWLLVHSATTNAIARAGAPISRIVLACSLPSLLALLFYRAARRRAMSIRWRIYLCIFFTLAAAFLRFIIHIQPDAPKGMIELVISSRPDWLVAFLPLVTILFWAWWARRDHLQQHLA